MFPYKKFLVKEADKFDPQQFSFVSDDVEAIRKQTEDVPASFKTEIILSFLKNHSMENEWIQANPALTGLVRSGVLPGRNTGSLFESSNNNPDFRKQMEDFIAKGLTE